MEWMYDMVLVGKTTDDSKWESQACLYFSPETFGQQQHLLTVTSQPTVWLWEQRSWSWKLQPQWKPEPGSDKQRLLLPYFFLLMATPDKKISSQRRQLAQIYNKPNEGQSGNRPWTQWIQVPTAKYLSCREVIAQSHMQGESAHAWYHHNYGSHAHCEALDNPGSLQHPPLLGSHLCWREKSESQRQTEPERKQTKLSDLQSVLKVNNEHHKSR